MLEVKNQYEVAFNRLLHIYKDKPNIVGLLKGLLTNSISLEEFAIEFLNTVNLDNAYGVFLDLIGAIFNVPRNYDTDDVYRKRIISEIYATNSDSTTEAILSAFSAAISSSNVKLINTVGYGVKLEDSKPTTGVIFEGICESLYQIPSNVKDLCQLSMGAGIGCEVLVSDIALNFQPAEFGIGEGLITYTDESGSGYILFDDDNGDTGKILYKADGDLENTSASVVSETEGMPFLQSRNGFSINSRTGYTLSEDRKTLTYPQQLNVEVGYIFSGVFGVLKIPFTGDYIAQKDSLITFQSDIVEVNKTNTETSFTLLTPLPEISDLFSQPIIPIGNFFTVIEKNSDGSFDNKIDYMLQTPYGNLSKSWWIETASDLEGELEGIFMEVL